MMFESIIELFLARDNSPSTHEMLMKCVEKVLSKKLPNEDSLGGREINDIAKPFTTARFSEVFSRYSRTLSIVDFYHDVEKTVHVDDFDLFAAVLMRAFIVSMNRSHTTDRLQAHQNGLDLCYQVLDDYKANVSKVERGSLSGRDACQQPPVEAITDMIEEHAELISEYLSVERERERLAHLL